MNKEIYIDIMEKVVGAYSDEHIRTYTKSVEDEGLREHGFPRLTADLGILIAHGRKTELKDDFIKMMDLCCELIPIALERNAEREGKISHHMRLGNDFSVKEIVFCLLEVEKSGVFDKELTDKWRSELSKINPYKTYNVIASVPPVRIHNWAAFAAVSEQVRKYADLGDESAFIDNQIASQMLSFEENGMYRDPDEPIIYDLVPRLQLGLALHFGYDGKHRSDLEEQLIKSADITLKMQSVTGEVPYGGRSVQFMHNEAMYAAFCEFYAVFFKKRGNLQKAGEFKNAARMAVEMILQWLKEEPMRHVKNFYPQNSGLGCEEYAYFNKYMVTVASMVYVGYVVADEEIEEQLCPAASENYICETSRYFHKVFCKFNDYFMELDTKADEHYDASGIGRIHKKGAPSTICLTVPFSKEPQYKIDVENPSPMSICAGVKTEDGYEYTYDSKTEYSIAEKIADDNFVCVKLECTTENGHKIAEECTLSNDGVEINASSNGEVEILFPVFDFDGLYNTEITQTENTVTVSYRGYKCIYTTDGIIKDKNQIYANRNGHYRKMAAQGKNNATVKIEIVKNEEE